MEQFQYNKVEFDKLKGIIEKILFKHPKEKEPVLIALNKKAFEMMQQSLAKAANNIIK